MVGDEILMASLAVAGVFAAVHVLSPHLVFLDRTPRSVWLSIAGGVSTAYVFVHLLPELAHHQSHTLEAQGGWMSESGLFVLALAGLVAFYGLERMAKRARDPEQPGDEAGAGAFWIHVGAFALYNALISYLLTEQAEKGGVTLALYAIAMGLHYVVNDRGLYGHHGARYLAAGRWVLALATGLGWAAGLAVDIPETWIAVVFAFLAGGVILNVIKEELPEERESRFEAFVLGAGGYGLLLHLI